MLYERLFGESFLYFYRNRSRFTDWQTVIIYPTRSTEQTEIHPYRSQLNSDQVHRVFLDELGEIEQLPLGVALMALTTVDEASTPEVARALLERSRGEVSQETIRAIIEMITTILVYKFTDLNRQEAEAMLGITTLQETRFYQEAKEDGREEEGRALVLRLLDRRFGVLPEFLSSQIANLSLTQIESLAEALLDFQTLSDLEAWLQHLQTN
jgi:predicted transposase YdaD